MELQGLQAWEPVQSYPQVNLHLELNGEGLYEPKTSWNGG